LLWNYSSRPRTSRALLVRQPIDAGWIERMVDALLRGLTE
jgi:hypothetical protein